MLADPLGRLAGPFWRDRAVFRLPRHRSAQGGKRFAWIGPDESDRPERDGLGPFGVVTQGQAGDSEHGRLFGNAVRIGHHSTSVLDEIVEFEVTARIDRVHGWQRLPGFTHIFGGALMDGNITSRSRVPSAMPSSSRNNCCSQPRSRDEINAIHFLTSISLDTTCLARPITKVSAQAIRLGRDKVRLSSRVKRRSLLSVLNFGFQVSGFCLTGTGNVHLQTSSQVVITLYAHRADY